MKSSALPEKRRVENVDEETELAQQFQVMSIPTIILMKDGKAINQLIGVRSKAELETLLSSNM